MVTCLSSTRARISDCISGPNGAGKTTTLRMLMGFASPSAGEAFILGQKVGGREGDTRRNVGFLPDVPAFYSWMRAGEFLTFSGELLAMEPRTLKARVAELLDIAGLADVKTPIGGFSRGMRQRLGLAQALINRPKVVLLDEPTSALDPIGRREVLELIGRFAGETTVLFSTHILTDVERVCDTVAILRQGRLVIQEPIATLKEKYVPQAVLLDVVGDPESLVECMQTFSWVSGVERRPGNMLRVAVTDIERAHHLLPGAVTRAGVGLREYRVDEVTLEDIFMRLVNGT
ncbi:MAG: ABC transporter ATP-binding protein [Bacillota bacterium]